MARGCTQVDVLPRKDGTPLLQLPAENPGTLYAKDTFLPNNPKSATRSYLILALIFLWPLPFLLTPRPGRPLFTWMKHGAEAVVGILALYLYSLGLMTTGQLMSGGYLFLSATSTYLCLVFYELARPLVLRFTRMRSN